MNDEVVTEAAILHEFHGWETWKGIDNLWHARVNGATPPVIVTGEDLADLRDEIVRKVSQMAERWSK